MDEISLHVLVALAENDSFEPIEIIEPYVNANRESAETYLDIFARSLSDLGDRSEGKLF